MSLPRDVGGTEQLVVILVGDLDGEPWVRFGRYLLVVKQATDAATAEVVASALEALRN